MTAEISANPILITFPPSLDSELARFLLNLYRIEYQEKPHTLIFCPFATLRHGGTVIFPLLYGDSFKLVGPKPMADYFDQRSAPHSRLYPQDTAGRSQVESDWVLFNQTLAFATAKFAYYHLLPYRNMMVRPLSLGTPDFEARTVQAAYPFYAGMLRTLLGLTAQKAEQSMDQIRKVFDAVETRLAIQKNFLVGNQLTLSDVAFAVAAAPMVLPPAYGGPLPPFAQMPPPMQAAITEMRARPAGVFALQGLRPATGLTPRYRLAWRPPRQQLAANPGDGSRSDRVRRFSRYRSVRHIAITFSCGKEMPSSLPKTSGT